MKKVILLLMCITILTGCGQSKTEYVEGSLSDVGADNFYSESVIFCINGGYMDYEGSSFGIYEPVSLSECADIISKITDKGKNNPIKYVVDEKIAPRDFEDWDMPATRENVAYMLDKIADTTFLNEVIEGSVEDIETSYAREAIYNMYKRGIFAGKAFRPFDNINRLEMAIIVERMCDMEKRVKLNMASLSVSFIAFGDTIGHGPVIASGQTNGGYDFTHMFENVKEYIDKTDIACVNQETVFVESNFTGYPSFGSPEEIGVAEAMAGFDVVTHATNHAFDRGVKGIEHTTSFWENYENITMLGIHQDEEDAQKIEVVKKNGIRIAMLNYTYSLNGYQLPKGKGYMVDLLNEEKIKSDMERARNISDAIVVFAHWGNEYQNTPAQSQKNWAQLFADCGATVIVGHHPHVVQPLETVTSKDGREVPVYYSLGNFISNQNDYQNALCAMADFKIVKDNNGVRAEEAAIEPVITHMENGYYSAYLLKDYPEEKIVRHKHRGRYGQRFSVEAYSQVFAEIVE